MKCLSCTEEIPQENDTCDNCGWSYKDADIEAQGDIELDDSDLVCVSCLTPYSEGQYHCAKCGSSVGNLTRYQPFEGIRFNYGMPSRENPDEVKPELPPTKSSRVFRIFLYGVVFLLIYIILKDLFYKLQR
jgi:hypothetical protein